jgi:hypothetical protein
VDLLNYVKMQGLTPKNHARAGAISCFWEPKRPQQEA